MAQTPHFLQLATFGGEIDERTIDLTETVVRMAAEYPSRFKAILGGEVPRVIELRSALDEEASRVAFNGKLALPGFHANLRTFAAAIGLPEHARHAERHVSDLRRARWDIEAAERLLKSTIKGLITNDPKDMGMVFDHEGDVYRSEIEEVVEDWGYEEYINLDPAPSFDDEPARAAWSQRYGAWVDANICPFVHGTRAISLATLTGSTLIESYVEHEASSLAGAFEHWLESELDEHHEDAADWIKGEKELIAALRAWEQARLNGAEQLPESIQPDEELEAILTTFNSQQTLVSYEEVCGLLVTLKDATTHQDCIAWAQANLAKARQKLAALESAFELPAAAA